MTGEQNNYKEADLKSEHWLEATKIIADGIAQRKNAVNRVVLGHWSTWSLGFLIVAILGYKVDARKDFGLFLLLGSGIVMAVLSLLDRVTSIYLKDAENIRASELFEGAQGKVMIYRDKVVGVIALKEGQIKGWTVVRKYRGSNMGKDLLKWAIDKNASNKSIQVETVSLDHNAIRILRKMGFELRNRQPSTNKFLSLFGVERQTWVLQMEHKR